MTWRLRPGSGVLIVSWLEGDDFNGDGHEDSLVVVEIRSFDYV